MTKYPASNRRLEFLTHLAARSLYRTDQSAARPPEPGWRHWTLPAPASRPSAEREADTPSTVRTAPERR